MRRILLVFVLCCSVWAENPHRILNNFNAGELNYLNAREDLSKYHSGCSIMENMIPSPQGSAVKRPGTKYIAEVKTSALSTRLLPFEYSTEQSYVIEAGNQYMRFFTDSAAVLTGGGYELGTFDDSLEAHWKMNDYAASTNVGDASGNGYTGTAQQNTSVLTTTGKINTALSFNGTSDRIDCDDIDGVEGISNISIAGWFKPTAVNGAIVGKNGPWIVQYLTNKKLRFQVYADSTWDSCDTTETFDLNEWHHFVATYDGTDMKLYVDGSLPITETHSNGGVMGSSTGHVNIGYVASLPYFTGHIDDIRIYTATLTEGDVAFLYHNGSGTEETISTPIAYWHMNDNTSNTSVSDGGGSYDGVASGNTEDITADGKVGTGCFDLDGTYAIAITDSDDANFTFVEQVDGDFSITGWIRVTDSGAEQVIMSKWDETAGSEAREWKLLLDEDMKLKMVIADESLLLDSDLIAHWKLNDSAATTTVTDETGNHHGVVTDATGTATSLAHSVTGKIGNAMDFDGVDDYVSIADSDDFSFGDTSDDSPFSISAWINMDDATTFPIVSKVAGGVGEWEFGVASDDKLYFRCIDNDEANFYIGRKYDTAITADQGSWIHVVATYDATEASGGISLYRNGTAVDDVDFKANTYTAMHNLAVAVTIGKGYSAGDKYADGKIDNVMIFDKELSADDVATIYADGIAEKENLNTNYPYSITDDALGVGWRFIGMTYEGDHASWTGETAANYIDFYVDANDVDQTATNISTYTLMEDTTAQVRIGAQESSAGAIEKIWTDKIDNVTIFDTTLSAANITSLYTSTEIYEISTPYLTADLFELKYEQSADVLYITHPDYETFKLSRSNNDDWELDAIAIDNGPFRTQNYDVEKTITASATTGTVTLTASGHAPFVAGTTAGHLPSGTDTTSKSRTGALFKLIHPLETLEYNTDLEDDYDANPTEDVSWMDCGTLYKGAEWTLTSRGTWKGTLQVQRNYTIGAAHDADGWESVFDYISGTTASNVSTTGTEDDGDASYRVVFTDDVSGTIEVYFSTDQLEVIGIVEITAVTSSTSATGTVIETLGSTDATYKWAEGSWSNYRGWPQTVTFFEDRLCFGGNTSQPDTIWGSVTSDYENMKAGVDDDDAVSFTLSSRQVNVIEWLIGKDKLMIGTSGAEWTINGGADEPLTPSNVIAKQHSTYGSANMQATLANESILFFQRGKEKMRELAYNWETDAYVAPDMTIMASAVTNSGIDNTAFQKTPDSILWCVRNDGELPIFSYERNENITAWSRMVTQTNQAGTLTDSDFKSVVSIHGDDENEIWVIVERVIDSNTVKYIEQFQPRDFGDDAEDAFYVDSGITYDSTATSTITGLDHLEGETVYVLADGVVFDTAVVSGGSITLKLSGTTTTASTVQVGLGYEVHLRTMPLSLKGEQTTIHGKQKRISEIVTEWYTSGDFSIGRDVDNLQTYSVDGQTTSIDRQTFPPGWDRNGYIYIYQQSPEPLNLMSIMAEFNLN